MTSYFYFGVIWSVSLFTFFSVAIPGVSADDLQRGGILALEPLIAVERPKPKEKRELCHGEFRAEQKGKTVTIVAKGTHPTGGYKTFFEQSPEKILPPQFVLTHIKPTGIVTQAFVPFEKKASFISSDIIKIVIVRDAKGEHEVSVKQIGKREG